MGLQTRTWLSDSHFTHMCKTPFLFTLSFFASSQVAYVGCATLGFCEDEMQCFLQTKRNIKWCILLPQTFGLGDLTAAFKKSFPHPTQPPPPTFNSSHNGETTKAWSGCAPALITVVQKSDKEQHLILLQGPFPSLTQLFYLSNKKAACTYLRGPSSLL